MIDTLYQLSKPALFRLDPEAVHDKVISALGLLSRSSGCAGSLHWLGSVFDSRLAIDLAGVELPGPVGIAAGLDKNGVAFPALAALGWDAIEVGTITPLTQAGNPRPRVFRLPEDKALINRMGFPGVGADRVIANLTARRAGSAIIGCNIGPNKASVESGLEAVITDCVQVATRIAPHARYLVLNVSSPNTARLRELQGKAALLELLTETAAAIPAASPTPLFVKIAPDLTELEVADIVEVVLESGVAGIVATNTTTSRPASLRSSARDESGGLSGEPLRARSLEIVRQISRLTSGSMPIIAVGGIASGFDALAAIQAGATMVQVYSGLIYEGPGLANEIKRALIRVLDQTGANSLAELRNP